MIDAGVPLATDGNDGLPAAGMERIEDPNLHRRTSGIMTLV